MLRTHLPSVRAGFTQRFGGHSVGTRAGLNLALHVGDEPEVVARNRADLEAQWGRPLVFMNQVHGTNVRVIEESDPLDPRTAAETACDALVTRRADVALAVMVADCIPVLLVDPDAGVIGAAHVGRPGMMAGMGRHVLDAMRDLGARPERVRVSLGPSACGGCYEVPEAMAAESEAIFPGSRATTTWGTTSINIAAGLSFDLQECGVRSEHIWLPPACTIEDERFFSYRREPHTGRFAGIIAWQPFPAGESSIRDAR
ncbi:peptidoglycan editing factor PgeF [Micrococcales bacterium 31B]|nr:peptidoglycan editing factor PgeF [Micrococcales bacterium 31B]